MIELNKILEIIKTAHSLGAKRIEIDSNGSVSIEWGKSLTVPMVYPNIPHPHNPQSDPFPGPTMAYMAQFTTTVCKRRW